MNKEFYKHRYIEINDPPREACIIKVDKNGEEIQREYFGNNPRIEINKDYIGRDVSIYESYDGGSQEEALVRKAIIKNKSELKNY